MKLKEKLAEEYYNERPEGFGEPIYDFIAGFEKAREMIKAAIRDEIGSDEALKTIGFPFELGEDEVGEDLT